MFSPPDYVYRHMLLPLTILTVSEPLMCMHGTQYEWPMEALDTVDQIVQLMKTSKKKKLSGGS